MNMDLSPKTRNILDLTLEIICLLTAEDCVVMKKTGEYISHSSVPRMPVEYIRGQNPGAEPSNNPQNHERNKEQQILELSNQIISLLTGEVPIRCEDVTVHLSMEEWEYLEGHRDLYKNMTEDRQAQQSADDQGSEVVIRSAESERSCQVPSDASSSGKVTIKACRASKTSGGVKKFKSGLKRNKLQKNTNKPAKAPGPISASLGKEETDISNPTDHTQPELTSASVKEAPLEEKKPSETDIEKPGEEEAECPSGHVKEELASNEEGKMADVEESAPTELLETEYTIIVKDEPDLREDRDPVDVDTNTSSDIQESDCLSIHIKEESTSSDEGSLSDTDISTPTEQSQTENSFTCPQCDESFTDKSSFVKHQWSHMGKRPISCSDCGKCFNRFSDLANHQRIHAGDEPFSCLECGKCFTKRSNLVRHQCIHVVEKQFSCTVCGKNFTRASYLAKHQKIHTGEKPFSCSDCGKCFRLSTQLILHQRTHTGEKPYPCALCGKCFKQSSQLAMHQRTHTGEKPFYCIECGKCFAVKSNLVAHQKIHVGRKAFSCFECFTCKASLVIHPDVDTGKKIFSCTQCGKCFAQK
uniref:C2H2-type domain-containing protein n=1 Tax=Leptobrachium leishanense TaxID=445787 RepID=A0A8C5PBV7_9ANUR